MLSWLTNVTSSSAIAKRPRDASCLSVISFNITKRRAQYVIVSYIGYRFITVCNNQMLFCCLWCNVETSCHKHFVVVSRHQQTPPLTTSDKCQLATVRRWRGDNTWPVAEALTARDEARYWLRIAISAYPLRGGGGSCRNIAMTFGMEN